MYPVIVHTNCPCLWFYHCNWKVEEASQGNQNKDSIYGTIVVESEFTT